MSTSLGEAIRLLDIYTAGRFDIWMLAGSSKTSCRAHVMRTLINASMPQSKCGVTALRTAFYDACKVTGECEAHRHDQFIAFCQSYGGVQS